MPETPLRCSFCHEERPGGVAGGTPGLYICPQCIRRHHRALQDPPLGGDDAESD
jgi:hypothetical protein